MWALLDELAGTAVLLAAVISFLTHLGTPSPLPMWQNVLAIAVGIVLGMWAPNRTLRLVKRITAAILQRLQEASQ